MRHFLNSSYSWLAILVVSQAALLAVAFGQRSGPSAGFAPASVPWQGWCQNVQICAFCTNVTDDGMLCDTDWPYPDCLVDNYDCGVYQDPMSGEPTGSPCPASFTCQQP
jgi:hypothetical protein